MNKGKHERILDIGTGSGAQIRRNLDEGLLKNKGEIVGIDLNKEELEKSKISFKRWAKENGYKIKENNNSKAIVDLNIKKKRKNYDIKLYQGSIYDLGTNKLPDVKGNFGLITGLAVLEHTEISKALKSIKRIMEKGGYLYLLCNYDQHTVFGPTKQNERE